MANKKTMSEQQQQAVVLTGALAASAWATQGGGEGAGGAEARQATWVHRGHGAPQRPGTRHEGPG